MSSAIIKFEFREREASDLDIINRTLDANRFRTLRIEKFEGYLAEIKSYDKSGRLKKRSYRYGPDSVELICGDDEPHRRRRHTYRFRIDTDFITQKSNSTIDDYAKSWRMKHPFRVICSLIRVSFKAGQAYVILHRSRF